MHRALARTPTTLPRFRAPGWLGSWHSKLYLPDVFDAELHYSETYGDLVSISLSERFGLYWVRQRFGETTRTRAYLRWKVAANAYNTASDNAAVLVDAIENGIPECLAWPPQ